MACAANPMPRAVDAGVNGKIVTANAMRLSPHCRPRQSAPNIFEMSNRLEVRWVYATTDTALMVKFQTRRHLPNIHLISDDVSAERLLLPVRIARKNAVSLFVHLADP